VGSLCELKLELNHLAELEYPLHSPNSNISCDLHHYEKSEYMDDDEQPQSTTPVETVLLQKVKDDLERLLEDHGMEEYKGFGNALLADNVTRRCLRREIAKRFLVIAGLLSKKKKGL
jgi:hypothetical protein